MQTCRQCGANLKTATELAFGTCAVCKKYWSYRELLSTMRSPELYRHLPWSAEIVFLRSRLIAYWYGGVGAVHACFVLLWYLAWRNGLDEYARVRSGIDITTTYGLLTLAALTVAYIAQSRRWRSTPAYSVIAARRGEMADSPV